MVVVYIAGLVLLIAIVLAAVWLDRWSVSVILIALGAGIVFGRDILRLWHFDDMHMPKSKRPFALLY